MANRRNDAAFGLLAILAIAIFVLVKIFEFVVENILPIGIIFGIGLVIFSAIKFIEHREEKKQTAARVQSIALNELKEKYDKSVNDIEYFLEKIIRKLENINKDLDNYRANELQETRTYYDPIEAVSRLRNLIDINHFANIEIWDLITDNREFPFKNPREEFFKKVSEIEFLPAPDYFEVSDGYIESKKTQYEVDIEEAKIEFNKGLNNRYKSALKEVETRIDSLVKKIEISEEAWTLEMNEFESKRHKINSEVSGIRLNYFKKDAKALLSFYSRVFEAITYDENFEKSVDVDFNSETGVLIVEYLLPSIDQFPNVKDVRHLKSRNEIKEVRFSERELREVYDDVIYKIVLNLIDLAFKGDQIDVVESIAFNGWSNAIDRSTGLYNQACILSVFCSKNEFLRINLSKVDPKQCFKSLKGVAADKISNLTPVKPIISIDKSDRRFVPAQEVGIDSSTNLASMHWEDFEHLIRKIFEKEFSKTGGEVKVTQSSRDGGVDAIAFDPDPIRGGKIVIQAKRYTNIVGVSAVRDLYGTVMNEGANKGILVTTSNYGSDSYNFIKDKPLTLLNGGNLLYLLEKHGYSARINLKEAKDTLRPESNNTPYSSLEG